MPEVSLAQRLKILDGRFFVNTGSNLFFFQPETMSRFFSVIKLYISGISSGSSCKSASIVKTTFPLAILNPACSACDFP